MQDTDFLEAHKKYRSEGINTIPCTSKKSPVGEWQKYQGQYVSEQEFNSLLNGNPYGIGAICGLGDYGTIDIDVKYCLTGTLGTDFLNRVEEHRPELRNRLRVIQTPSKGLHLPVKNKNFGRNRKLARRYATEAEKQTTYFTAYNTALNEGSNEEKATEKAQRAKDKDQTKVLVETRGQGGFIVLPPTPGYIIIEDKPVPELTDEETEFMFNVGRSFDEVYEADQEIKPHKDFTGQTPYETTPWEDYNANGDVVQLLVDNGWTVHSKNSAERVFLTRPGKSTRDGYSADFNKRLRLFKNFSSSEGDFEPEKAYTPTSVFRILKCNGDPKLAAAELEKMSYGKRKSVSQISDERKQKQSDPPAAPSEPATLESFDNLLVTKEKDIPQPESVVSFHGGSFAIAGNISSIGAAPKSAKTTIAIAIVSGAISETGEIDGFPDIKIKPNIDKKAVPYFDTEQSEADQQHQVRVALKRAGIDKTPDYFRCYNLVGLDYKKYAATTETICGLLSEKFGGIHLIVIDGGADFIASVNDEEKSIEIIQYFRHLSIRHDCPVIIIVHQNPGSEKERGHFGSEIQRKCYGLLSIEKKGEIFTIQPKMMRRAGNADVPLIQFQYNQERGYHIQVDAGDLEDQTAIRHQQKALETARVVFAPPAAFTHTEATGRIMEHLKRKLGVAKIMLNEMLAYGYVIKGEDKIYRQNMEKVNKVKVGQNEG